MSALKAILLASLLSGACAAVNNARTTLRDGFKECLISRPAGSLGYCVGYGALSHLQNFDEQPEFNLVDGLSFKKDEKMYRDGGYNVFSETDPADFRTIIDSMSQMFSRRSMRWDMGFFYPGLAMRLAPSANNAGLLEFVVDGQREATFSQHSLKEASTARILTRQFLLPFLLGFKFNIATLVPIIFGIIAIIAKKAVILSKIALIISSAFGLGTLLLGGKGTNYEYGYQTGPNIFTQQQQPYRYHEEDYHGTSYRTSENPEDHVRLYDPDVELKQVYSREDKKGRNFAWSDAEKSTKV